ncbi:MAG: DMT family transporter [Thermoplasmatota archaeon]
MPAPSTRAGFLLIVVSAVSFGGVAVLTKLALATGLSVLALSFWRWAIAFAALSPIIFVRRARRPPPRLTLAALALGVIGQFATSGLYTASLAELPANVASFLLYLSPVFVALAAATLLRERLTRRGVGALALAVLGLAFLTLAARLALAPLGVAFALAAAVAYSATIVTGRRLTRDADGLVVAWLIMAGATASFGAAALATRSWSLPLGVEAWREVVLLGVFSTALPVGTFYLALPRIGAPRAALVSTLEPVSTIAVAYFALGETFAPLQLIGAAAILVAVALLVTDRAPGEGADPSTIGPGANS